MRLKPENKVLLGFFLASQGVIGGLSVKIARLICRGEIGPLSQTSHP